MPHEFSFDTADNLYSNEEFFKICNDYEVPNDSMRYRDEKFYCTYQQGVKWPDDYIGPDSMMHWIIKKLRDLQTWGCLEYQKASGFMCT